MNPPLNICESSQRMSHPVSQGSRKLLAEPGSKEGELESFNPKQSVQTNLSTIKLTNNVQQQKLKFILGQLWIQHETEVHLDVLYKWENRDT